MNNEKLVSVVIPTYSRPTLLERTINSILNQTYKNIEIIVVDDNNPNTDSRKETELIMEKYKNNSKVIYLQHDRNRNGSAARNTGWKHSSGEYITFVDDDDEIKKTRVEKMINKLELLDETWGMCYSGYELINEKGNRIVSANGKEGNCYINALMRTLYMGSGSNLILRKNVVNEINGYDEDFKRNQDLEFLCRATKKYKIAFVDEILLTIHRNDGNRTNRTLKDIERIDNFYIEKFKDDINALPKKDKKKVLDVISLERFRFAMTSKKYLSAFNILIKNKVSILYTISYICYLVKRIITHTSYGFEGRK